jgi:biopolymer transport protein ExbD
MAELDTGSSGGGHKKGKKPGAKKLSTRIDMTPMVDLAFLLLTFFMLTTTFNKPKVMEINMPVPNENNAPPTKVEDDIATTILIGKENKLFYYSGVFDATDPTKIKKSDYSKDGIRKVLIEKNKKLYDVVAGFEQQFKDGKLNEEQLKDTVNWAKKQKDNAGIFVIIKAVEDSNYENIVNILDEMNIVSVVNFALVDITEEEKKAIETL